MADGIVQKATQALTVLGLVALPAYGGQLASAAAKAKIDSLRSKAAGSMFVEFLVDLGGGLLVGALELGAAAMLGSKGAVMRVLPYAGGGAILGATLPVFDRVVDKFVKHLVGGAVDVGADAAAAPAPGGRRRTSTTLRALPGGAARDNVYERSRKLRVPGGGMTIESNQATPVPLSTRLVVPARR